jgi:tetratricopeptide (TPR) repeat protein
MMSFLSEANASQDQAVSADRNKWAAENYRRGGEAIEKKNWDLAIENFGMCVKLVPDNLVYRQLLRNTTRKKYNENGTGAGMLAKAKLMGIRSRLNSARKKADWLEVDKAAEEGLLINPWDVQLLADLGEAHKNLKNLDIARESYRLACAIDKNNKDLHRSLAEILAEKGEYDEATRMWEHVYKLDPLDGHARNMITSMQTLKTTHRGGYDDAKSTLDVTVKKDEKPNKTAYDDYAPTSRAQANALAPGESVENDLKQAIRKEPENIAHYTKLGLYYRKNKQLDEAAETYKKALQISGNSADIRELVEDVELDKMRLNIELGKARAAKSSDPVDRENVSALSMELIKREIEILGARVERYPQDMNKKYDLALRFMKTQKWTMAIPQLQKACLNPKLKGKALLALGKCFIYDKKLPLARAQLERALPEMNHDSDPDSFKEAHYLLGRVLEELGDKANAEKHYGEVYSMDSDYKDVRKRYEDIQGGTGAEVSLEEED